MQIVTHKEVYKIYCDIDGFKLLRMNDGEICTINKVDIEEILKLNLEANRDKLNKYIEPLFLRVAI